jgi:DNA-binding MarR family transcriptional regulator
MDSTDIEALSYVLSSKRRVLVLHALEKNLLTPSLIANKTNLGIINVSKVLIELRGKNLVSCINPEKKRGRLYSLTELGQKIQKHINDINQS